MITENPSSEEGNEEPVRRKVVVTVLVDDRAGEGLTAEHGWSLWIRAGDTNILFDTGQGRALPANAHRLGIDLSRTGILFLSHGHYDHTGGVAAVLTQAPHADVYCHPSVVQFRYSIREKDILPVGMPPDAAVALTHIGPSRLHWVSKPVLISEHIGLSGPILRETEFEDTGGPFFLDLDGKHADPIEDDMALWIRTDDGLVVCVGCCHSGVVNTLNHARRINGDSGIRAVIGGFHLMGADPRRMERTANAFRRLAPGMIVPGHCTGEPFIRMLSYGFGSRVFSCRSGMVFEFG